VQDKRQTFRGGGKSLLMVLGNCVRTIPHQRTAGERWGEGAAVWTAAVFRFSSNRRIFFIVI